MGGPPSGHGGGGSYLYAEADGASSGDVFRLTYDGTVCTGESMVIATAELAYHMYSSFSSNMGTLRVLSASGAVAWSRSGKQGDEWHSSTSIPVFAPTLVIEYIAAGSGAWGDAALDDVVLTCGVLVLY